ncbi:helix-turn-helix transcriptional regulator [Orbus wheelerorum]|uniref:AraC family transcriptional regulator n=1 Tax=Orbus wheelerorum TaxID=3074111 RepID=UPI00370D00D4
MLKKDDAQFFSTQYLCHDKNHQTPTHCHAVGQLYLLNSGLISCNTKDKHWSITPNCLGWIPPMTTHSAISWGKIAGWSLYIPASWCHLLPANTCILRTNELISAIINRLIKWPKLSEFTDRQIRLITVLIDEMIQSEVVDSLLLPYPTDPRLVKITQAIWHNPLDSKTQVEWANWAGISIRSLSRHFMRDTGMTFSHWKHLAKVILSLEKLTQGLSINEIAYSLGFSDASTYIASFKSIFGVSPKRYFN